MTKLCDLVLFRLDSPLPLISFSNCDTHPFNVSFFGWDSTICKQIPNLPTTTNILRFNQNKKGKMTNYAHFNGPWLCYLKDEEKKISKFKSWFIKKIVLKECAPKKNRKNVFSKFAIAGSLLLKVWFFKGKIRF